jgi:hypothetical protein
MKLFEPALWCRVYADLTSEGRRDNSLGGVGRLAKLRRVAIRETAASHLGVR